MTETVIKLENISKQYRLGTIGTQTIRGDLQRWWYKMRGKNDPSLKIGQENTLSKAGGEYVWALKDINLEVKQGEVLGIIGKNGAGKSTLLKLLSQVTTPTTGQIKVKGRIASLLEVGTGFHPELSGKENIFLNAAILGMTKNDIKLKLDEIVEFAGVAKYLDTPVKRYSSGMYVRLAFAVAAHLEPDILVVDEVLAVGDAEFQKKAIGKMQDVSKSGGRTVLFVSHNMASINKLCERCIMLQKGKVVFDDITKIVIDNYLLSDSKEILEYKQKQNPKKAMNLRYFNIINSQGSLSNMFRYDDFITINIEYEVNKIEKNYCIWVGIKTSQGVWAFNILDVDYEPKYLENRPIGYYKTKVKIPSKWLNAGKYFLTIGIWNYKNNDNIERLEDITTFSVTDIGTLYKGRLGILQPYLKWETTKQ